MGYLRNKSTNAVTSDLRGESIEYQQLTSMRDASGFTVWEEIAQQDIGSANRVFTIVNFSGAAAAANETVGGREPERPGTITDVRYVANSPGIVGAATNSRTLTIVQGTAQGAGAPARTTLATLALVAGVNAPAGQNSTAFTINVAAFIADAPLELVSTAVGTGIADPGGIAVITYTPA